MPPALNEEASELTCLSKKSNVRLPIEARKTAFSETSLSDPLPDNIVLERPTDMVAITATNTGISA